MSLEHYCLLVAEFTRLTLLTIGILANSLRVINIGTNSLLSGWAGSLRFLNRGLGHTNADRIAPVPSRSKRFMIGAEVLIRELRRVGFAIFSGVPCSYLTPLINGVIDSTDLRYIGAANEGDAVAVACGVFLGHQRGVVLCQNSGLGNAVNPLSSLALTCRIPLLLLTTWRGQPGRPADEPQHETMGQITPALLDLLGIPWEMLPDEEEALEPTLARVVVRLETAPGPFAFIIQDGDVQPGKSKPKENAASPMQLARLPAGDFGPPLQQDSVLRTVRERSRKRDVLLATTGYTGRALYALGDEPNQFYMVGSMGCVSSLGLGLAVAQPDRRMLVIDGDGSVLMRMGALATLGRERPANLVHLLLDNGVHDSTGGQHTVAGAVDLTAVALACGYPQARRVSSLRDLAEALEAADRLTFLHVKTSPRTDRRLPRPVMSPAQVAQRLRRWLETS
jgi:phosphonopyruvate decarboxylase